MSDACLMYECERPTRIRVSLGTLRAWPMCTPHLLGALHNDSAKMITRLARLEDSPWQTR